MIEEKTHFKMYKAKKKWMIAGVTMFSTMLGTMAVASADTVNNSNNQVASSSVSLSSKNGSVVEGTTNQQNSKSTVQPNQQISSVKSTNTDCNGSTLSQHSQSNNECSSNNQVTSSSVSSSLKNNSVAEDTTSQQNHKSVAQPNQETSSVKQTATTYNDSTVNQYSQADSANVKNNSSQQVNAQTQKQALTIKNNSGSLASNDTVDTKAQTKQYSTNVTPSSTANVSTVNQNKNVTDANNRLNAKMMFMNFAVTDTNDPQSLTDPAHNQQDHLNVEAGWSNDVQSIVKNPSTGQYDIYFLHSADGALNPFGNSGQNWEHVTTSDFKHYQDEGAAINAHGTNDENSWKSAWTGSVIQNKGNIEGVPSNAEVAYFSGLSKKDGSQNIWAAWSDDNGKTFTHALNNGAPVLAWDQDGASGKQDQERDADVIYWNNEMLMYCAEGDKFGVYKSTDGIHWEKADPNGESKVLPGTFYHGGNWSDADIPVECPQIREMNVYDNHQNVIGHKTVLFFGGKDVNGNPPQTTGTYYVVGHLDQNGLFAADGNVHRLDLGSDYYGSNLDGNTTLDTPVDSLTGLGWIGNWGYTANGVYDNQDVHNTVDKSQETEHLGAYSTPRKLILNSDGTISSTPLNPLVSQNNSITVDVNHPSNGSGQKNVLRQDDGGDVDTLVDHANDNAVNVYDLNFKTKDGKPYKGRIYIDLWQGKDYVRFNYDPTNGWMQCNQYAAELDNDNSGMSSSNCYKATKSANTGLSNVSNIDLKVITDKDSVELFFPNGQVYTVERFATQNNQDFKVYTQDPNNVNELTLTNESLAAIPSPKSEDKPTTDTSNNSNPSESEDMPTTDTSNNSNPSESGNQPTTGTSNNSNPSESEDKPTTEDLSQNKGNQQENKYTYTITYFDDNTGAQVGTATFDSPSKLSNSQLSEKVQSETTNKVNSYNIDQDNIDGNTEKISIIAMVNKAQNNPKVYNYSVGYFDDNTGASEGTYSFTSNTPLSGNDLLNKVQSGSKDKVNSYKVDENQITPDGNTDNITIIAMVNKAQSNPKVYNYSVGYFDDNTGASEGTYSFTSNTPLSGNDLLNKVQSGSKDKVNSYKVDENQITPDGNTDNISIVALVNGTTVSTSTPNNTSSSVTNSLPTTDKPSSNDTNKPNNTSSNITPKPANTSKPNSTINGQESNSTNKPVTNDADKLKQPVSETTASANQSKPNNTSSSVTNKPVVNNGGATNQTTNDKLVSSNKGNAAVSSSKASSVSQNKQPSSNESSQTASSKPLESKTANAKAKTTNATGENNKGQTSNTDVIKSQPDAKEHAIAGNKGNDVSNGTKTTLSNSTLVTSSNNETVPSNQAEKNNPTSQSMISKDMQSKMENETPSSENLPQTGEQQDSTVEMGMAVLGIIGVASVGMRKKRYL